ncbi:TPA: hypothetical protein NQO09_004734 [Pseudomonas aeruginosa]|uniref:hypothetical protein n=1 Tax=Pseudomonas aeruginosa TaxID=287 RepID=UPI0032E40F66|nr:hypothetical protein [Pseudomonas aeruginosa]
MEKQRNDATRLIEAISYQLTVTLEYCHSLVEGQSLWLERFGDVSTEGKSQVEVKDFADALTDGHINFWNTLKNWLAPRFKADYYSELILLTTQKFGVNSEIKHWNELNLSKRIALLKSVHESCELRLEKAGEKKPSITVSAQRFVMADERRNQLMDILEKISIISNEPCLVDRANAAKSKFGIGLDPTKRDDYFQALLGYLIEPGMIEKGWKISYEDFDMKIATLRARYSRNSRKFPVINSRDLIKIAEDPSYTERIFVKKLHEIEYGSMVSTAILHHIVATHTILDEFKRFTVDKEDVDNYKKDQMDRHASLRRAEVRRCSKLAQEDWCEASQSFFDTRCGDSADPFPGFDSTSVEFRNGILHILAEEVDEKGEDKLHWRLW